MTRKMTFDGVSVPAAKFKNRLYFQLQAVAQALGYAKSIGPLPDNAHVIEIGRDTYVWLSDLQVMLGRASGERKIKAAGFLQQVSETYSHEYFVEAIGMNLDETTRAWVQAKNDIEEAKLLLADARATEETLWRKLEEERNDDE